MSLLKSLLPKQGPTDVKKEGLVTETTFKIFTGQLGDYNYISSVYPTTTSSFEPNQQWIS